MNASESIPRSTVLQPCFFIVAGLAQCLPVVLIPEQSGIATMRNDVVNYGCLDVASLCHALHAQRVRNEISLAGSLPCAIINDTKLSRKKRDFTVRERHIRNLLERIDYIECIEPEQCDWEPSCTDVEEFFRRTRRGYPVGPMIEYADNDVLQFIHRIVVFKERIEVEFKAGVTVTVERQ